MGSLGTAATTVVQQVEEGSRGPAPGAQGLTAGHRGQMIITCLFTYKIVTGGHHSVCLFV